MKTLALLFLALALASSGSPAVEIQSGAVAHSEDHDSTNCNEVVMMSVGSSRTTTDLPPGKRFEAQIVRGSGHCSVRIETQGGPLTSSTGGIELTTGNLYNGDHEATKKLAAITTDGTASVLVIVVKKGP